MSPTLKSSKERPRIKRLGLSWATWTVDSSVKREDEQESVSMTKSTVAKATKTTPDRGILLQSPQPSSRCCGSCISIIHKLNQFGLIPRERYRISDLSTNTLCPLCGFFNYMKISPARSTPDKDLKWQLLSLSARSFWGLPAYEASPRRATPSLIEPTGPPADAVFFAVVSDYYAYQSSLDNIVSEQITKFIVPAQSPSSRWKGGFVGRAISASRADFDLMRSWLEICFTQHGDVCEASRLPALENLRVIDCETRGIVYLPTSHDYVALSYLWGNRTELDPEHDQRGILPSRCPLVIEDAIVAVKRFNFRYLWVDRYCINQDDEKEKHTQIANMDSVYSAAKLTIIAAAGEDPSFGLPGVSERAREPQPQFKLSGLNLVSSLDNPARLIKNSRWMARAWTYQEGLLSRRRVIFTSEQVYFQCLGMYCLESILLPQEAEDISNPYSIREHNNYQVFPTLNIRPWPGSLIERLNEYAERDLSYESDRLNAALGVLKTFEKAEIPIYHFWGLPLFDIRLTLINLLSELRIGYSTQFACGLAWDVRQPGKRNTNFPSWSWVGWSAWQDMNFEFVNTLDDGVNGYRYRVMPLPLLIEVQSREGGFQNWDKFDESEKPNHLTSTAVLRITPLMSVLRFRKSQSNPKEWIIQCSENRSASKPRRLSLTRNVLADSLTVDGILLVYTELAKATYLLVEQEADHYARLGIATFYAELDSIGQKFDQGIMYEEAHQYSPVKIRWRTILLS
jgi:hypothetical protein